MLSPIRRIDAYLIVWMVSIALPCAALEIDPPESPTSGSWPRQAQFVSQPAEDSPEQELPDEELPNFDNQVAPPEQWLEPAQPCDCVPAGSAQPLSPAPENLGPVGKFVWDWAPEGVVPYWGRRTPDYRKDFGIGGPLTSGGWRAQPFSISGFAGATNGGPIIRNHVDELPSAYAGVNFGWDYDHFWGIEKRLGFGALNLVTPWHQRLDPGLSVTGEYRVMYYPLGDTRWRPFVTLGIGWSDFYFIDEFNHRHIDTLLLFPYGVGLKYLWNDRWALRIDLIDELTLSSNQTSTFHYVALTAGLEFRYGKRLINWPWHRKGH
ncbi:MAG TPA: hypothetical protein VG826_08275 [Pirellulales bacterium]|nr:hypothetical protein [Pirellulales bacterium]